MQQNKINLNYGFKNLFHSSIELIHWLLVQSQPLDQSTNGIVSDVKKIPLTDLQYECCCSN